MLIDVFDPNPDSPRTLSLGRGGDVMAAIIDGSGSWGSGDEAARWMLTRLEDDWGRIANLSDIAIAADVARVVDMTPNELRNGDFGWGFSVTVVVCRGDAVTWYSAGFYSVDHFQGNDRRSLVRPRTVADDLIERGASDAEVAAFAHARVIVGPYVGDGKPTQLSSGTCVLRSGDSLTVTAITHTDALQPPAVAGCHSAKDLVALPGGSSIRRPAILVRA